MKILFITYASAIGRGGHVHSMLQISDYISEWQDTRIMNLGDGDSCVLKSSPKFTGSCDVTSLGSVINLSNQLRNKLEGFQPDIIHCFDEYSYLLLTHCKIFKSKKFVYTKCGGPSSANKFWFYADHIILFSIENYNWYKTKKQYRKSNIKIIPNRVRKVQSKDINIFGLHKNQSAFNFIRIGRIGQNYKDSIISLINLVEMLKNRMSVEKRMIIHIIGIIEDDNIYSTIEDIAKQKKIEIQFITDERTVNASQLLGLADCVLGTGRGLMEAMSLGIPTLTPVSNNNFPVLVDKNNFSTLSETNFSPRNFLSGIDTDHELLKIEKMISDKNIFKQTREMTLDLFETHLDLEKTKDMYDTIYMESIDGKRKFSFINKIYLIKYLITYLWI